MAQRSCPMSVSDRHRAPSRCPRLAVAVAAPPRMCISSRCAGSACTTSSRWWEVLQDLPLRPGFDVEDGSDGSVISYGSRASHVPLRRQRETEVRELYDAITATHPSCIRDKLQETEPSSPLRAAARERKNARTRGNTFVHAVVEHAETKEEDLLLLKDGFDVHIVNEDGNTPLHLAIQLGKADLVRVPLFFLVSPAEEGGEGGGKSGASALGSEGGPLALTAAHLAALEAGSEAGEPRGTPPRSELRRTPPRSEQGSVVARTVVTALGSRVTAGRVQSRAELRLRSIGKRNNASVSPLRLAIQKYAEGPRDVARLMLKELTLPNVLTPWHKLCRGLDAPARSPGRAPLSRDASGRGYRQRSGATRLLRPSSLPSGPMC